jgi:hypothetical protein
VNNTNGHPINQEREDKLRKFNAKSYEFFKWFLGILFVIIALSRLTSGAVVSFLCLALVALLVLPPVTQYLREEHKFHIHTAFKIVGIIVLSFMAFMNASPQKAVENVAVVVDKTTLTPDKAIEASITEVLGSKNNTGKQVVRRVELTKYSPSMLKEYGYKTGTDISTAFIEINSSENLTANLQKGTMNTEAMKIFKAIFAQYPNIGDITLWSDLPMKDKYGNVSDDRAIIYSMARPLYDKVNWTNFYNNELPELLKSETRTDDRNNYVERVSF